MPEAHDLVAMLRGRCYYNDALEDFAESLDLSLLPPLKPGAPVREEVKRVFHSMPDECSRLLENTKAFLKPEMGLHLYGVTIQDSVPHGMMQPSGSDAILVISNALVAFIVSLSRILLNGVYPAPKESRRAHEGEPDYLASSKNATSEFALERDARILGKLLGHTLELGHVRVLPNSELDQDGLAPEYGDRVAEAAIQFVVNHEAAHFLQGHHQYSQTRKRMFLGKFDGLLHLYAMEAEADDIAAKLLCEQVENCNGSIAHCGVFVALRALSFLERGSQRHAPSQTHPPASERLLRVEQFLFQRANLDDWFKLRYAMERRSWILEDYMSDHGLYVSPFETMIRNLHANPEVEYERSIGTLLHAFVFGDADVVAKSLGILSADADLAIKRQLVTKAIPDAPEHVAALVSRLSTLLKSKAASGQRILDLINRHRAEHMSLHMSQPSYWIEPDRVCLLETEPLPMAGEQSSASSN